MRYTALITDSSKFVVRKHCEDIEEVKSISYYKTLMHGQSVCTENACVTLAVVANGMERLPCRSIGWAKSKEM